MQYLNRKQNLNQPTLSEYIQFLGNKKAANIFGCSEATCKSWRYGYRQPSISQAKRIIEITEGRLNYESIDGSVSEILEGEE